MVALIVPKISGTSPYLASNVSVPLDDCQTCSGSRLPSYQTLAKIDRTVASGCGLSSASSANPRSVTAAIASSRGLAATAVIGTPAKGRASARNALLVT